MDRTFERSTQRRRRTLNGEWEFVTDPDDVGTEEGYEESFPSAEADQIQVPCSWNAVESYEDYVGPAWYRRTFDVPESTAVKLTFQAVGHDSTVYLDGEEILAHAGGYTPFSTYVRDLEVGEHELVVRADNSPDEATLLHDGAEWFPHGGIYREVVLEEISGLWVTGLDVGYEIEGDDATVDATVTVHNVSPTPGEGQVEFSVGDESVTEDVRVGGLNAKMLDFEVTIEDVDRWSPGEPTLYDVVAVVTGDGGDDVRDRIGFREIETDGRDVLLNGEPIELVGVNYRESHPDWGHALPSALHEDDVEALVDAGFNTVRCAEYPPHPRFLDRCDEAGILVIEGISPHGATETASAPSGSVPDHVSKGAGGPSARGSGRNPRTARGTDAMKPTPNTNDPTGEARRILVEMVQRDVNHPSVVAWSLGTETAGDEGGLDELLSQLRGSLAGLDETRLVVAASGADEEDERASVFRYSDVLCVNAEESQESWDDRLDRITERYLDKPVVVTAFGTDGVSSDETAGSYRGAESAQADYLADAIETFRDRDDVSGFILRQFCDSRSFVDPETSHGSIDYSGILTGPRQEKEAYRRVQQLLDDR